MYGISMKLALFLIVNFLGFLTVGGAITYALHNTQITDLPEDLKNQAWMYLSSGTMIVWIVAGVLSIFYLFLKNSFKFVFLLLPVIAPIAYAAYILSIF